MNRSRRNRKNRYIPKTIPAHYGSSYKDKYERPLQRGRFRETHTWERGREEMKSTGKNAVYVVIRRERGSDQGLSGVITRCTEHEKFA